MKVTTLIEDKSKDSRLKSEFGLSLYIETEDSCILLDTGTSNCFVKNCDTLGVDLRSINIAVISHGHSDHGGGLQTFFELNDSAPIYMHSNARGKYYANVCASLPLCVEKKIHPFVKNSKLFCKYIGLDQNTLARNKTRIKYINETTKINKNTFLIASVEKKYKVPEGNKYLLYSKNGVLTPDTFNHEIILVIEETDGIVFFTGCCHNGLLNMIKSVKKQFKKPIKAILGGFHLKLQPKKDKLGVSVGEINKITDKIISDNIQTIVTGHCTGQTAYDIMKQQLGNRLQPLFTGSSITI